MVLLIIIWRKSKSIHIIVKLIIGECRLTGWSSTLKVSLYVPRKAVISTMR